MRKAGWLVVALLLVPVVAHAQTVIGTVTDQDTGAPIAGAVIELVAGDGSASIGAQTDSVGMFLIVAAAAGQFVVNVTHPEYVSVTVGDLALELDEALEIEILMGRDVVPLDPLRVTARRSGRLSGYYDRLDRPGFARFITRDEIARRPGARTTDLLRDVPGVHVRHVRTTTGTGDYLITMRLGQCLPVVYIDGIQVRQGLGSGPDLMLRPEMIEGIEVYRGSSGVPAQFVSDGCGVVAFWTRTGQEEPGHGWTWKRIFIGAGVFVLLGALVASTR